MSTAHGRYPGAQPFADDEVSRKAFFGREQTARALTSQILANKLVVVYAKSGLGKTSLLNAGIAQRLREEGRIPLIVRVNDVTRGPLVSVLEGIQSAAERQSVEYIPGRPDSLWTFFKTVEFWRGDLLLTPILILDQFEELFTLHARDATMAFLAELGYLVRGVRPPSIGATDLGLSETPPSMSIVLSLREDYLGYLDDAADRIPQILDHRFRLTPLSAEAAAEAMTGPAAIEDEVFHTKPFRLDPDTVATVLRYLSEHRTGPTSDKASFVEPFHLQLICQKIEAIAEKQQRQFQSDVIITMNSIGGEAALRHTLTDFYLDALGTLYPKRVRRAVRRLCEDFLISPEGRRLSLNEYEIRQQLGLYRESLQQLVNKRLLRSESRADTTYYELSHDALVEPVLAATRARALLFGWVGAAAGSVLAILFISLGSMFVLAAIVYTYQSTDENKGATLLLAALLFPGLFVLGLMPIPFVRRHYRTIQRFRQGNLIEPADPGQGGGRRRDWALGRIAVGAGSISLLWAGVFVGVILFSFLPKHILSAWNLGQWLAEPGQRAMTLVGCGALIFVHVVFGTQAIRWGREAIGRYQGTIKPPSTGCTRSTGVRRIVAGFIAVFGAALWGGGLVYLLSTAYSRKGEAPDWVPSQYHSIWKSVYNHDTGMNLPYQIIAASTLLLVGLVLIGRSTRSIRILMGTTSDRPISR
jgi:hypothetical protein